MTRFPIKVDKNTLNQKKLDDIQGLRAIAVLLVLGFHLWPELITGGYVGVDVFFVISGYLMTEIVLREYRSTGTLSVSRFFVRRIRRIVPPAAFVVFCVAVASPLLPETKWQPVSEEIIASALFVQNWLLAFRAVDYLAQGESHGVLQPVLR